MEARCILVFGCVLSSLKHQQCLDINQPECNLWYCAVPLGKKTKPKQKKPKNPGTRTHFNLKKVRFNIDCNMKGNWK